MSGNKESVMNRKAIALFALLITLIGITDGAASAQTQRKVTLEAAVPFEFVVGNRAFPAGRYTFEMATGSPKTTEQAGVLVVHDLERKFYVAVATDVAADANPHIEPKLVFMRNDGRVYLSKVWRQGNVAGLSVHLTPSSAAEDSRQQESVVFILAATSMSGGF